MGDLFRQTNIGKVFYLSLQTWCVLLFVIFAARAERLPIRIYTSADGFSTSASFGLVRDSRGFIWLCSRDGLVRFDGYRFITYSIGDSTADKAILDLIPTRSGVYWINLNRGTDYRFVPQSEADQVESVKQQAAKNDYRIPLKVEPIKEGIFPTIEDSEGNLYASDEKAVFLAREKDGQINYDPVEINLPGNPTNKLTRSYFEEARSGGVWIGTNWGLVHRFPNGKTIHFSIDPQNDRDLVRFFAEDAEKRVWIAHPDGLIVLKVGALLESENLTAIKAVVKKGTFGEDGQAQMPEKDGEAFLFSFKDVLLQDTTDELNAENSLKPAITQMMCASDGKMWLTSRRGLVVFDGKRFHHYTTKNGLTSNLIASVVEDNEGYIWFVSYGGLHRINPNGLITFDETNNAERSSVTSIFENREGELQVVSGDFNISGLRGGNFKMVRPHLPKDDLPLWQSNVALLDSQGDWWVTSNKSVYRFTGVKSIEDLDGKEPSAVYNSTNGLIDDTNVRIFEDSRGDIWISTNVAEERYGLTRWERSTGKFQQFFPSDGLPETAVAVSSAEDKAGNLWFGFINGEVARFRDGRFTIFKELEVPNASITNIFCDNSGRIWISNNREGVTRVDDPEAENPTFRRYTIGDGLTSNNVRSVTEDLYGNIYIGTVRGVNRLTPETGRIKYFGTSDGLASDFVNTSYRDRNGAIWFGTHNGLSRLIPEPDKPARPPTVLISGLRIAGEEYSISPLGQKEVFVPDQSANRNNLQIDFLSISTGADASTRYQYKLEGVDADWSLPTVERSVTLANLSSGSYRFLVQAINSDDVVSENPAAISFTVLRPVWQRWWFLTIASVLIGLAIYALYRYRIEQIIKLERVRTRIATDLHDDIGSSLSKIAILSEVVRQKTKGNGASEPLEIIANTSREMVDSMSDIVWAINPERDSLSDLIHRMRRFAEDILDAQDIEYEFIVPEHLKEIALGADVRRDVYLIFKECLNNLAKHSKATEAEIKINMESEKLIVEIKDNGHGFTVPSIHVTTDSVPASNGFGGNGLRNMRRRTKNFGGDFQIDSEIGKGTRIFLQIPVNKKIFAA
ncbi:MAG TPA: two-component regulator propeller domain-containing protein [Pyrinomonadaceae bacterium]|jgi:signal transduction histidine kinase/ligand-binding sensor domain-containing protein